MSIINLVPSSLPHSLPPCLPASCSCPTLSFAFQSPWPLGSDSRLSARNPHMVFLSSAPSALRPMTLPSTSAAWWYAKCAATRQMQGRHCSLLSPFSFPPSPFSFLLSPSWPPRTVHCAPVTPTFHRSSMLLPRSTPAVGEALASQVASKLDALGVEEVQTLKLRLEEALTRGA